MLHKTCRRLSDRTGTKFHIGRNIPIFGKAPIVAAVSLALAGHDPLNVQNSGGDKSVRRNIFGIMSKRFGIVMKRSVASSKRLEALGRLSPGK